LDLERLLESFGDDAPSGENLEYEVVFSAMEMAAQPGEERQIGDSVIEAEDPDYRDISEKALAVLEQSHDLRAAVILANAELRLNGLEGFAKITGFIRGCLETYWDSCHPQLDADDDDDPTMRVNAVLGLADDRTIVKALRNTPLTQSNAFGRVSLRDIAVAAGEVPPAADATNVLDSAGVSAAFKDTDKDVLKDLLDKATQAFEHVKAIDAVFDAQTPGQGPDLSPLIKTLYSAVAKLREETGGETAAADDLPDDSAAPQAGVAKSAPSGAIASQRDVEMTIDRILAYYATHEPSSPLPILLHRAKRLVGADFMTIMKDIAPRGIEEAMVVGGITEDDD
jgi:type VI secretion system protein ImpA